VPQLSVDVNKYCESAIESSGIRDTRSGRLTFQTLSFVLMLTLSSLSESSLNSHALLPVNPANPLEQISLAVYQAVVSIQQQQPEWIVEKYRDVVLQPYQTAFVNQLQSVLKHSQRRGTLAVSIQQFLQHLLVPGFFESSCYQELLGEIEAKFLNREVADRNFSSRSAIAILLLDAENIKLNRIEERMLICFSTLPVKVKIAFANWRNLGKYDLEFHERGYQMIHVPTGKNAADMQMTAIGASLFLHYPHAQEVFVCSGDAHLLTLSNLLQSQGWKVHALRKWGTQLILTDWTTGRIKVFTSIKEEISLHDELEQRLTKLLLAITAKKPGGFVGIGVLASHYEREYDEAITEVMKSWGLGSNFIKFLLSCSAFKMKEMHEGWQVAIRPILPEPIAPPFSDPISNQTASA